MRILGILLENIRSYKKETIILPLNGITVIYGPSGSGKTSLLMSIRFALFGVATGQRSKELFNAYKEPHGADLLRVDASRGRVRLLIAIGKKLYAIERVVEKRGDRYSADTGVVEEYVINEQGVLDLTRRRLFYSRKEMDDYVLSLLGLREKKSERGIATPLVFTTALYVPQFSTHEVLQLGKEEIREIVSRALGIEKYKAFRNHFEKITRVLEKRITEVEVKIEERSRKLREKNRDKLLRDMELKQTEYNRVLRDRQIIDDEYNRFKEIEKNLQQQLLELSIKKRDLLRDIEEYGKLSKSLDETERKIEELLKTSCLSGKQLEDAITELEVKFRELINEKALLDNEIGSVDSKIKDLEDRLKNLRSVILENEKKLSEYGKERELYMTDLSELESEYRETMEFIKKGVCPKCKQPIVHEHGLRLIEEKESKVKALKTKLDQLLDLIRGIAEEIEQLRLEEKSIEYEKNKLYEDRSLLVQRREKILEEARKLSEILGRLSELVNQRNALIQEIRGIDFAKLQEKFGELNAVDREIREKLSDVDGRLEELNKRKEDLSKNLVRLENEIREISKELMEIDKLSGELQNLQKTRKNLEKVGNILDISYKAVDEVEKKIMKILVGEFRNYFYEYLSSLVPDQPIEVVVTDEFNIVQKVKIRRASYDVVSLSGGQNIAVSLAYRLALNQTVRQYSPMLKKSILILDEPTTGFSRDLVNRLKEVLKNMSGVEGQVLVVTHDETLIEAGDCKIRLSLDPAEHITIMEYEECFLDEDYRILVERILTGHMGARKKEFLEISSDFEPKVEPFSKRGSKELST